jgi:uncharacterized protein
MEQRAETSRDFHVLAKPIGPICNLACKYCFYLEKETLYPGKPAASDWILQDDVLEEYIRQYIASKTAPAVSFGWQGGEPTLLGVDYFRKVLSLQQKHANGRKIENTLQTNGILLDDRWCDFLATNRFLVGLSLDGPRHLHDRYRLDKGGKPSFDRVMRSIGFLKKHGVEFNTLTVVQRHNSQYPLDVYRFLKEIGHGFMQFIPIVERVAAGPASGGPALVSPHSAAPAQVSEWSVEPTQYGKFLCAIFDDWVRSDVGKIFVQLFDVALAAWVGVEPGLCVFQRSCGSSAVIEHNGDVYSCDHYVYPENRLGNIMDQPLVSMLGSSQQVTFGRNKLDQLPRCCRECGVRFVCNGECPKHRFVKTADGEENLNYLCPGYKLFFSQVAPHMEFMAAELRAGRPPANIMSRMRDRTGVGKAQPGRNDPCPCGSGLKYKRCCGQS